MFRIRVGGIISNPLRGLGHPNPFTLLGTGGTGLGRGASGSGDRGQCLRPRLRKTEARVFRV